jgi:hypothetical protein
LENTVNNLTNAAENPLLQQAQIYVLPIGYNQTAISPLLLYQTSLPNLNFTGIDCGITFAGVGHTCALTVTQRDLDGLEPVEPDKNFFVKIDFLSSGSTTNFKVFNGIAPANNLFPQWDVKSLQFGGFLATNVNNPIRGTFNKRIYGYLFKEVDDNFQPWELPELIPGNVEGIYEVLQNNTLIVPQFEEGNSWSFLAIDLPKSLGDKSNNYFNINVKSTVPAIEAIISSSISKISINFYKPVNLSSGNLSIIK